jgi:hypothetical protein
MTSIIKVDNLQNQCGANIISESANVITIGASGDTVTLAAGASQSGFGRSGSVNWDTTPKTSSPVTAVSGNGYFINTTSGAITVNLPATPAAGDIVSIADYNGTAATNNITVGRNGSNINSSAANFTISRNYAAISFVYVDATAGWRSVDTSDTSSVLNPFVVATGGTITTCGNYKIHTFTGPGTFTVTNIGPGSSTVDYLVVAGGGSGGRYTAGGGGAGGFRYSNSTFSVPGAPGAPLASATALPVSVTGYPITVGGGGAPLAGSPTFGPTFALNGNDGSSSIFSTITSAGGGGGGGCGNITGTSSQRPGGSGGGAARYQPTGGSGNTPPVSPPQGRNGGNGGACGQAGGGGAIAVGANYPGVAGAGGAGGAGAGLPSAFGTSGQPSGGYYYFSGGGGAGNYDGGTTTPGGVGGIGGGGTGGKNRNSPVGAAAVNGTTNTGGGGGGDGTTCGQSRDPSGAGGSGIVVIRYQFQ